MSAFSFELSHLFSAEGLVVIVTGGGTGIGLMIATALENNGATVYIVGRRKEIVEKAAKEHAKFGKLIPVQGDVSSKDSLLHIVSTVEREVGYINLLVNNAGISGPILKLPVGEDNDIKSVQKTLWETPLEDLLDVYRVNVAGVYYTTVAFLELLDNGNKHGGIPGVTSQVISISSVGGLRRDADAMMGPAYATSKAAVNHLGKILSSFLKDYQIRSNIIAPGLYPSEMADKIYGRPQELPRSLVPLGRMGTDEDMGALVLFLATRGGAYISGNIALTDGGRLSLFSSTY